MDNIEQAKKWFKDLFQGCYLKKLDKYPDYIFWIYDKNLIRQRKLSKITGIEKINLEMSEGEIIFEQHEKSGYFYIEYYKYWTFLESNFNLNTEQVRKLTSSLVNDVLNSKEYTTVGITKLAPILVNDVLNSKEYTTIKIKGIDSLLVNDVLNSKEYTTQQFQQLQHRRVNDVLNSKEYKTLTFSLSHFQWVNEVLNSKKYTTSHFRGSKII